MNRNEDFGEKYKFCFVNNSKPGQKLLIDFYFFIKTELFLTLEIV